MSTEILGYIAQAQNIPQTNENAPQQPCNACKDKLYYAKQKLTGIILIVLGIMSAVISDDGTFLVFMILMSIPFFGKDKVLMIEEEDER